MKKYLGILILLLLLTTSFLHASKLSGFSVLDQQFLMLHFKDGEVIRRDDGTGACAFMGHCHSPDGSRAVWYGGQLVVEKAVLTQTYMVVSEDDPRYAGQGLQPARVYRKSKVNGMSIKYWVDDAGVSGDYIYDHTMEHHLYLELPLCI